MKSFGEYISEASISQKKRDVKFAKSLFTKGRRIGNIKSFGIITSENPDGQQLSASDNKKRQTEFVKNLKDAHYVFVRIEGSYGNKENPYLIFNIKQDSLMSYAKKYEQESFIYAEVKKDGNVPTFEYWEKKETGKPANNATNPYIKKDESVKWSKEDDATDYYTVIGKDFKFNINFSIFESVNDKFEENINKIMEERCEQHDRILERSILRGYSNQYYTKHVNSGFEFLDD